MLITAKAQTNLIKIFIVFLIITHPEKKKCICGNNKPFMAKTYYFVHIFFKTKTTCSLHKRAFMQRTRFRNKFLKNPTEENKLLYKKQKTSLFFF